jgi:hypothetical protein
VNGSKTGPALAMLASVCDAAQHPVALATLFRQIPSIKRVLSQSHHESVKRYCKASGGEAFIGEAIDDSARITF